MTPMLQIYLFLGSVGAVLLALVAYQYWDEWRLRETKEPPAPSKDGMAEQGSLCCQRKATVTSLFLIGGLFAVILGLMSWHIWWLERHLIRSNINRPAE